MYRIVKYKDKYAVQKRILFWWKYITVDDPTVVGGESVLVYDRLEDTILLHPNAMLSSILVAELVNDTRYELIHLMDKLSTVDDGRNYAEEVDDENNHIWR